MGVPIPDCEPLRLEALRSLRVLDTPQDPRLERIVLLASQLMDTPIGLVSLVDAERQWFKARLGVEASETPRDVSFCAHAILQAEPLVVENAVFDSRFADNPVVTGDPNIRFYAGAPLVTRDGYRLGTLCVADTRPRRLRPVDIAALRTLAAVAMDMLETSQELGAVRRQLQETRGEVRDRALFTSSFGHELRTPLGAIMGFAEIVELDVHDALPPAKHREYAAIIGDSARHLLHIIDGMVRLEKAHDGSDLVIDEVEIIGILEQVVRSFEPMVAGKRQTLVFQPGPARPRVHADETALRQIAINLISNAAKYSPEGARITVSLTPAPEGELALEVADTGPGIPDEVLGQIGRPYLQSRNAALRSSGGIGLGLRITKQLAASMHCGLSLARGAAGGTTARLVLAVAAGGSGGTANRRPGSPQSGAPAES
jgi:signal transduction histidine kinase